MDSELRLNHHKQTEEVSSKKHSLLLTCKEFSFKIRNSIKLFLDWIPTRKKKKKTKTTKILL